MDLAHINNIPDKYNLFLRTETTKSDSMRFAKDVIPQLKDKEIKIAATVSLSKEGIEAMRKQGLPGQMDVREAMEMDRILPKLKMDPAGEFYFAMAEERQILIDEIKENKGTYNLADLTETIMEAYAKQYDSLVKSYEDGSRDIYLSAGMQDGKLQFHHVSKEEDVEFLDQAFDRTARGLSMFAEIQEQRWKVNHIFAGEPALAVELPVDYTDRILDSMSKAQEEFKRNYDAGMYKDISNAISAAKELGIKYMTEDKDFTAKMKELFKGIKPMPNR